MKKLHTDTLRRVHFLSDINFSTAQRERRNVSAAMQRLAKQENINFM